MKKTPVGRHGVLGSSTSGTPRGGRRRTPGSVSTSISAPAAKPHTIVAIAEGRGRARGEVGTAAMDLGRPEVEMSQFADTASYSKLRIRLSVLDPSEILVPDAAVEKDGNMKTLVELLHREFPDAAIATVGRKHYHEGRGLELLTRLKFNQSDSILQDVHLKYYSLASLSALLKYVEFLQNVVFAPKSLKIVYKGLEDSCLIDPKTVKYLELMRNVKNGDSKDSLYGALNRTKTHAGARMLRSTLLQPSCKKDSILARQEAIEELLEKPEALSAVRELVGRLWDIEELVGLCAEQWREESVRVAQRRLSQLLRLHHTLTLVPPLRRCLQPLVAPVFRYFYQHMLCDSRVEMLVELMEEIMGGEKDTPDYPSSLVISKDPGQGGTRPTSLSTFHLSR